jgi:hypothetical protein
MRPLSRQRNRTIKGDDGAGKATVEMSSELRDAVGVPNRMEHGRRGALRGGLDGPLTVAGD